MTTTTGIDNEISADFSAEEVLTQAHDCVIMDRRSQAGLFVSAAAWADLHPADNGMAADWLPLPDGEHQENPASIPEVSAPAIVVFAARIGQSTTADEHNQYPPSENPTGHCAIVGMPTTSPPTSPDKKLVPATWHHYAVTTTT